MAILALRWERSLRPRGLLRKFSPEVSPMLAELGWQDLSMHLQGYSLKTWMPFWGKSAEPPG